MKIKLLLLVLFGFGLYMNAQDLNDALRFGREDLLGTARFTGMGGAFSSLGGDLSALRLNPAGSSVFATNHASLTLNLGVINNDVSFTDGFTENSDTTFDLNQAGVVMVYAANSDEAILSKYAYGFTYDQVANMDDRYVALGNSNESIDQFFLDNANGIPLDLLVPFQNETISDLYRFLGSNEGVAAQNALLGYQSFIIDPVDPDDFNQTEYVSSISPGTFLNDYYIIEDGYNGRFSFNTSVELKKRFYFGLNLNAHYYEYDRYTSYREVNPNPGSQVTLLEFQNRLQTRASAFSFQLGTLVKITNQLRGALSYQSPTWYVVSDRTSQFITTRTLDFGKTNIDPRVINIFPDYNFRVPHKWTGGLSYIFGRSGLLSVDYTIQDFSNSEFTTNAPSLELVNQQINDELTQVSTLNVGGEYVFKRFKFRGGYFLQGSSFEDEDVRSELEGFSFGLGYTIGNTSIDLAYTRSTLDRNDFLYDTGLSNLALVESNITNIFLTFAFGF